MIRTRRRRTALLAAGVLAAATLIVSSGPAYAQTACDVTYDATFWTEGPGQGGFTAHITITSLGDPINGWTLAFTLPAGQSFDHGWSASWSGTTSLTATNLDWNASLGTTTIGFNGRWTGSVTDPTGFVLNGVPCTGAAPGEPPTMTITSPADGAHVTAPADVTVTAEASDPDGAIDRVEFFRNGALAGSDVTAPYSFTHTDLPAGTYLLLARAVDGSGLTAEDSVTVIVDPSTEPAVLTTLTTVTVLEGGSSGYGVSLSQPPDGTVVVTTTRTSGSTGITVTQGGQLTFDASNWDQPQPVTVAAADGTGGQSAQLTSTAPGHLPAAVTVNSLPDGGDADPVWSERFLEQYDKIKNSGYFSSHGIPYHSIETLIVEAPDYGHVTTSEAFSYWLWLEANYGRVTGDWAPFNQAWQTMETYIIPGPADQPSAGAAGDAIYAAEHPQPSSYPSVLDSGVPVGQDPLRGELQATYGTGQIYGMHWLLDVDNAYGYGHCGDGVTSPAYINTFQRGEQESVWETVPHPSCETFDFGGPIGFLDLFVSDPSGGATQWRYTNAPDADARAVQAAYWALTWARQQGNEDEVSGTIANAARMGDYLRYALFDKYFKRVGNCVGPTVCPGASGRDAAHYLLSWYYAWGGSYPGTEWSWRIGSSHNHVGYQNPLAAWALSTVPELIPESPTAQADWAASLDRQLEFYQWLQSAEGALAGGATNSWGGAYGTPPAGTPTFYGMFYDEHPVYEDPGSNEWFGFQVWSLQRVAEYLYLTGDPRARQILDRWVPWAMSETTIAPDGDYLIPATMQWTGAPETWDPDNPLPNDDLHVTVTDHGQDVGVAAAYARTLMWYAAATGHTGAQDLALALLEGLYGHMGDRGVTVVEERGDYDRFLDQVFIPSGWTGVTGTGEQIAAGVTFFDLRESLYQNDPAIDAVLAYANGTGPAPTFEYHRSWAQMDLANAFADYAHLFPAG